PTWEIYLKVAIGFRVFAHAFFMLALILINKLTFFFKVNFLAVVILTPIQNKNNINHLKFF
ncbi:hypothetical protein ACVGW7_00285, partial [Enterobacter intestinihominis]